MEAFMAAEDSYAVAPPPGPNVTLEQENRSRNLLARVRSILSRMTNTDPSAADFAAHLEGRLSALWRVEDAFNRNGADLELLILDELQALGAPPANVILDGPAVRLDTKASGVLILAIHELATNALKFGAIGRPDGRLVVTWSISLQDNGSRLRLNWQESGVPIVARAPRHEGFGHDVITQRIAYELGGSGDLALSLGGVSCSIEIPL